MPGTQANVPLFQGDDHRLLITPLVTDVCDPPVTKTPMPAHALH